MNSKWLHSTTYPKLHCSYALDDILGFFGEYSFSSKEIFMCYILTQFLHEVDEGVIGSW